MEKVGVDIKESSQLQDVVPKIKENYSKEWPYNATVVF